MGFFLRPKDTNLNQDKKHLNGANLPTQIEENMNLMFYDFNNASVIPEET